ncbi:MAG: hypothetical protein M3Q48_15475, partial [Actinomycetota bacterium]|nr:hypothetical protein [Actinomycetota bacterium]
PATTGPRGTTVPTAAPAARRGSPARPDDEPTLANTGGTSSAPAAFALLGLAAAVHALRPRRGWR